jgi:hypothetical protein
MEFTIKRKSMKKFRKTLSLAVIAATLLLSSCEKDAPEEELIKAQTSLRLVHSSYNSRASAADLYVDDVKLNTSAALQYLNSTSYFPIASGSRKISVKHAGGTMVADTTINIGEGKQYSLFIKDRSYVTEGTLETVPLNTHITAVVDNSTSAPAEGKAKVRFVNMSSMPLNTVNNHMTFLTVNPAGSSAPTTVITQTLGLDLRTFASEYSSYDAGQITFRAQSVSPAIVDLTTTLEAGKLYTLYVVSTEFTVKTPTKSPIALKIIPNN